MSWPYSAEIERHNEVVRVQMGADHERTRGLVTEQRLRAEALEANLATERQGHPPGHPHSHAPCST
jgi:hypothetical protein